MPPVLGAARHRRPRPGRLCRRHSGNWPPRAPTAWSASILSAKLSATIESAQAAARELEGEVQVEVVDSTSVSLGQGLLVLGAARAWPRRGRSLAEVAAYVTGAAPRLKVYGVLDTLGEPEEGWAHRRRPGAAWARCWPSSR